MNPFPSKQSGFSLIEAIMAVVVLSILASSTLPAIRSHDQNIVEKAAGEIARLFRLARDEARRTGVPHGVDVQETTGEIRVCEAVLSPSFDKSTTATDPVSKKPLAVNLAEDPLLGRVTFDVQGPAFEFDGGGGSKRWVLFDSHGIPYNVNQSVSASYALAGATIAVTRGATHAEVALDPVTGQVEAP